jgi:hypothetical protein
MKLTKSKLRKMIKEELLNEREEEVDLIEVIDKHFIPLFEKLMQYSKRTTYPKWKKAIDQMLRDLDKNRAKAATLSQKLGTIPLK